MRMKTQNQTHLVESVDIPQKSKWGNFLKGRIQTSSNQNGWNSTWGILDFEMEDFECLPSLYIIPSRKENFRLSENQIINFKNPQKLKPISFKFQKSPIMIGIFWNLRDFGFNFWGYSKLIISFSESLKFSFFDGIISKTVNIQNGKGNWWKMK